MWLDAEADELAVWADELQIRGDPWGELVATSLAAKASESPDHRARLERRVAELEGDVLQPRVRPLIARFPGLRPIWEHGAMVGLRVTDPRGDEGAALLERMTELLRLPAARFLWLLRVDLWATDFPLLHREVPRRLLEPEIVARPRMLILGNPPWAHPGHDQGSYPPQAIHARGLFGDAGPRLADPERGLLSLIVDQGRVELPWKTVRGSRVHAFAVIAKRVLENPMRLAAQDRVALARALWDRSDRVQADALRCLRRLGVDAASFLPDLALQPPKFNYQAWLDALTMLLRQPAVVQRVVANFELEQFPIVERILRETPLDLLDVDRIAAVLDEPNPPTHWAARIAEVRRRLPDPPRPARTRPVRALLGRVMSWFAR